MKKLSYAITCAAVLLVMGFGCNESKGLGCGFAFAFGLACVAASEKTKD